jgi:hypothetical protein
MKGVIESISLVSGPQGSTTPLEFKVATANVLVGPNHSGKSLLLGEIKPRIDWPYDLKPTKVLKSVQFAAWDEAAKQKLVDELRARARRREVAGQQEIAISLGGRGVSARSEENFEQMMQSILQRRDMTGVFWLGDAIRCRMCLALGGEERLAILKRTSRSAALHSSSDLISNLSQNDRKRRQVQQIVRDAFGCTFVIDLINQPVTAKFSEIEPPAGAEKSLLPEAVEFFRQCVGLETMSDGVRAFVGMVAAVIASEASVVFIDEPEAFLHPELCTRLAKELCRHARENNQQLFIATHSAPFLMGCVQSGVDLNIVRLTYQRGIATSRILTPEQVVPLMRRPLLRSAAGLAGIFYSSVVITESDADRAFYDEINHRCVEAGHHAGVSDALFLNAHSWQQIASLLAPLRRLGVAAAAIVDLDVLLGLESTSMQALLESAGVPPASRRALGQLRGDLNRVFSTRKAALKKQGFASATPEERRDLENFVDQLAAYGVFLVPVGELEGWLSTLNRRPFSGKREWLFETFQAMGEDPSATTYVRPQSTDVWEWMVRLRQWLQDPRRKGIPG